MSGDELDLPEGMFEPGAPRPITDTGSDVVDLSELIEEVEPDSGAASPPTLLDRPSMLWGISSGLHSSLLSTAAPTHTAQAWESLAQELLGEAETTQDAEMKAALICEAGRILVERLGRQQEGQLLMKNSASPVADTLLGLASDPVDSLAHQLSSLEAKARDGSARTEDRAAAWVEFGLLCEEHAASRSRAMEAYEAALAVDPSFTPALALASEAAILDDDPRAKDLLGQRNDACQFPTMKLGLLLDLAETEPDPARRREILEQAHRVDPLEETALRRLIRTVAGSGEGAYLGRLYRKLAAASEDPLSASTALHLAFLTQVEAGEDVDDLVAELAATDAGYDLSDILAPLMELALYIEQRIATPAALRGASEALPDNAAVLERVARALDAPKEQALVREQLARLRLRRLREFKGSAPDPKLTQDRSELVTTLETDLRFCLVHLPEHRWVREALAELLEYRSDHAGLVVHFQEWARMHTAGPGRATILLRLGGVHEHLRKDLPRAAEVYELAVAEDPDNPDCLRALGRAYEKMRRWQQAIACLQRQARESTDGPQRLAALRRVVSMAQNELRDIDLAVATLQEVVSLDPDDLLALFQLAALCRAHDRLPVLVSTLQSMVRRLDDPVSKTTALVELGEVLELSLKQRDQAREAYEQALALTPGYTPALRSLARLYRDNGDLESLLSLHEPEVDTITDPAILALKAGRVCLDEVGDIDRAIGYLQLAFQRNPDLVPARELLMQLLTANGRIRDAYDLLRSVDLPKSKPLLADYHYRLGLLAEALSREPENESSADAALQHYRGALAVQPDHGLAWERSRRMLVLHNDLDNLVLLYEQRRDAVSGEARTAALIELARLHTQRSKMEAARGCYEEAAQLSPGDPLIRREYEVFLRMIGDEQSLPSVHLASARQTADTHLKATLLVEGSEIMLRSPRPEDRELAASAVLEALREDPGNPYAVRHLERLLAEPDPPLTMSEAVGARAVRAQSDGERALFYLESAELLERGGAQEQSRRAYKAALAAMPGLVPAELGLERVSSGRAVAAQRPSAPQPVSIFDLVAQAREAVVKGGASGDTAHVDRAVELLVAVLDRDPNQRDGLTLTRNLLSQIDDPAPLLALVDRVFPMVEDPKARYQMSLVVAERTPRLEDAARYLEYATAARPDGREALRALAHTYRQMGRDDDAAEATERLLTLYGSAEPAAVDLRIGLARYLANDPQKLKRALDHGRLVLKARPDDKRGVTLMVGLLERNKQRVDAAMMMSRLITRERDPAKLHDLYQRQARLLATSGEHQAEALTAAQRAIELNPGNRDTVRMLATLLEQSGQFDRLAVYLPPIRRAMLQNVQRGAVSIRDLRLLSQVARGTDPELQTMANLACYALDPTSTPPPEDHLQTAPARGLRRVLEDSTLRSRLLSDQEHPALHELLSAIEPVLPRLAADFPTVDVAQATPLPHNADASAFSALLNRWASTLALPAPQVAATSAHNAAVLLGTKPPALHIGSNLWMQGDATAWRGLGAVAMARHAFGAALARALPPIEMDLLVAACFESVGVFNAITADPDPRRLRDLSASLGKLVPRRQRKGIERACSALSSTDLVPSASAAATLSSDLRLATLMTADFGGCLSAACLMDGVAGGSLKQRISRSAAARTLLGFILSDDFLDLWRALRE